MLRKLLPFFGTLPYDSGHEAPSTEGPLAGEPLLETKPQKSFKELEDSENQVLAPDVISIQALLVPTPIINKKTKIQMIDNSEPMSSTILYDPAYLKDSGREEVLNFLQYCRTQSIKLLSTDDVKILQSGILKPLPSHYNLQFQQDSILYERFFCTQTKDLTQYETDTEAGKFITPPGSDVAQLDIIPFLSYGGYFRPGITKVDDIYQTYFTLNSTGKTTILEIPTQKDILSMNAIPPMGGFTNDGFYIFMETTPSYYKSLAQNIREGEIKITLRIGDHIDQEYFYESFNFVQHTLETSQVDIHFRLTTSS